MKDSNIPIIKEVIQQFLPGSRMLLFGSRAKGTNREDSDYDILVLIKEDLCPREKMPYRTAIRCKWLNLIFCLKFLFRLRRKPK
jgi:predicted nucleotidyltransferase